ncbi:MAG: MFS transporter [Planctomycetes bacterium]|nr:MFS transporter [Planctomycetota bacterium]
MSRATTDVQGARARSPVPVVLLTVFLDMVGFSILFPIFPAMLDHYFELEGPGSAIGSLRASLGEFAGHDANAVQTLFGGLLGSVYSLLQFLFAPVWGGLSDRIGRRPTLLLTLSGTCLGYVLWIVSGSFWLLVLSRLFCGLCSGNISTASAVIADVTEGKDRARGMGLVGMSIGLGFILGPVLCQLAIAAVPLHTQGWSTGLALNPFSGPAVASTLLALANLLWIAARFRETLPPERRGTSHHARVLNPFAQLKRLQLPGLARTNYVTFLFLAAFSGMEFTLTFLAAERLGYAPRDNVWMFVFSGLLIAIVQGGFVRRLAPRLGEKKVALQGLIVLVPGFAVVGFAHSGVMLYCGLALMAVGSALAMPCLSSLVSRYAPGDRQGLALGTNRSMMALARALGPIAASLTYWRWGSTAAYLAAAAVAVLPVLLALGLPPVPTTEAAS